MSEKGCFTAKNFGLAKFVSDWQKIILASPDDWQFFWPFAKTVVSVLGPYRGQKVNAVHSKSLERFDFTGLEKSILSTTLIFDILTPQCV